MFDKLFFTNFFYKRDQNIFMKESTQLLSYFICSLIERHNSITCICPLTGIFFSIETIFIFNSSYEAT